MGGGGGASLGEWEHNNNKEPRPMRSNNISIFHECMVWIEKSVMRVTVRHHEACRVMPNSDPE